MMEKGVCSFLVSTRRDQKMHESIPVDTETLTQDTPALALRPCLLVSADTYLKRCRPPLM